MSALHLDSLEIEIADGLSILLWGERVLEPDVMDIPASPGPPLVFTGRSHSPGKGQTAPIYYCSENMAMGQQALVLFENTTYHWKLRGDSSKSIGAEQIHSTLKAPSGRRKAEWHQTKLKDESLRGNFKVANYLGSSEIRICEWPPLRFEIQTWKFDFHGEYRAMVEEIADHCQQLLLEWDSPTSFNMTADPDKRRRTLLEQFLFLRHVLGNDRLGLYLEEIGRRPHVALRTEREWRPASLANSPSFVSDPLRHSRDWHHGAPETCFQISGLSPGELLHERRFESYDTPSNRFIKFALSAFSDVCEEVLHLFDEKRGTAWLEAAEMRETLDVFLAQPFFADVSPMRRLPLENQTLQKREGYRDILRAWLMLETAAKLDWPGRDDAYDGTNRDAATLYEFWLYFAMRRVLNSRMGMLDLHRETEGAGDTKPFVATSAKGERQVNLSQGEASISRYRWTSPEGEELGVHLFYNRTFSFDPSPMVAGTYSRQFRPDYTLVFFPAEYLEAAKWDKAEELAEAAGRIGYLHFDAKFRIETVEDVFGQKRCEDLNEEHAETKASDTYKRGDLYKMHTYNDAIRRTAGSYVLYPGREGAARTDFPRYEEVVPGVGAFRMRPGDATHREECEKALSDFIADVLTHHGNRFSRNYRIRHWTHTTLQETPPASASSPKLHPSVSEPLADALCVLGYVRPGQAGFVRRRGRFYFYAVDKKTGTTRNYDQPVFHAKYFIGHNKQKTLPWLAKVKSVKLESATQIARLTRRDQSQVGAAFYYLMELGAPLECPQIPVSGIVKRRGGEPVILSMHEIFGRERLESPAGA
jgi:predicted component of viral defense system (DUF524 family)